MLISLLLTSCSLMQWRILQFPSRKGLNNLVYYGNWSTGCFTFLSAAAAAVCDVLPRTRVILSLPCKPTAPLGQSSPPFSWHFCYENPQAWHTGESVSHRYTHSPSLYSQIYSWTPAEVCGLTSAVQKKDPHRRHHWSRNWSAAFLLVPHWSDHWGSIATMPPTCVCPQLNWEKSWKLQEWQGEGFC